MCLRRKPALLAPVGHHVAGIALLVSALAVAVAPVACSGQAVLDTVISWTGYLSESSAHISVYRTLPGETKTGVVIIRETAANRGRTAVADARFLAEKIANLLQKPASELLWVFHWGAFSHHGAEPSDKDLFLKAAFKVTNGKVSPPQWRIITEDTLLEYTDRQYDR